MLLDVFVATFVTGNHENETEKLMNVVKSCNKKHCQSISQKRTTRKSKLFNATYSFGIPKSSLFQVSEPNLWSLFLQTISSEKQLGMIVIPS